MRLISGAAATLLCGVMAGACTAVSGLNNYSGSTGDIFGEGGSAEGGAGDDSTAADSPAPLDDASDDVVVNDPVDSPENAETGGPPVDAGTDGSPPLCTSSNCNGCCGSDHLCHGGSSVDTCGKSGVSCVDCTSHGGACNAGVCGTAPKDASTTYQCTSTSTSACTSCAAVLYTSCCKSDHTCGCQWTGFAPCG